MLVSAERKQLASGGINNNHTNARHLFSTMCIGLSSALLSRHPSSSFAVNLLLQIGSVCERRKVLNTIQPMAISALPLVNNKIVIHNHIYSDINVFSTKHSNSKDFVRCEHKVLSTAFPIGQWQSHLDPSLWASHHWTRSCSAN